MQTINSQKTMKRRSIAFAANIFLTFITIGICLVIGEGILRLFLNPVDFLMPYVVADNILGHKVKPHSAGHDAWGFRNKSVPSRAEIVTIGDSQTYGVSAIAQYSWPAQLGELAQKTVYNISLGDYSPVQYSYLLREKAIRLQPSLIIVGLYFGNDFLDVFRIVYSNDYWEGFRNAQLLNRVYKKEQTAGFAGGEDQRMFGGIRDWLAHHSVFYRIVTYYFGDVFRNKELQLGEGSKNYVILRAPQNHINTGLTPVYRLAVLNLGDEKIQEGLRISVQMLKDMHNYCVARHISFLVVLIPTKESVFRRFIENNRELRHSGTLDSLFAFEREANSIIRAQLDSCKISFVDVLEPLRNAAGELQIYPSNADGHPNKNGYKIIAEAVYSAIIGNELLPANSKDALRGK